LGKNQGCAVIRAVRPHIIRAFAAVLENQTENKNGENEKAAQLLKVILHYKFPKGEAHFSQSVKNYCFPPAVIAGYSIFAG
jgi:hypothetical protein